MNKFEGAVSVRAVIGGIEAGVSDRKIERVLFADEWMKEHGREGEEKRKFLGYLRAMSVKHSFELEHAPREMIDELAEGSGHGGLLAFCGERTFPEIDAAAIGRAESGFFVMLDGVEDPYNFGYAVRSVYAAGVDGIVLPRRNWMSAAGTVCRSSAGASERAAVYTAGDGMVSAFKDAGYRIVCADAGDGAVDVYSASLRGKILLVVGGEKRGISRQLSDAADLTVRLPYGRDFPLALSAASAAAVLAFEALRQRRNV